MSVSKTSVLLTLLAKLGLFCLMGCATSNPNNANLKKVLSIREIEKLTPGSSSMAEVSKKFGLPDITKDEGPLRESWNYTAPGGYQLAKLVFDVSTKKLLSILWVLQGNEAESKLEYLKKLYPSAHYIKSEPISMAHDVVRLPERNYIDKNLGMTILVDESRNEVEAIHWFVPGSIENSSRQPSSN